MGEQGGGEAVSYTHLDVYKRQNLTSLRSCQENTEYRHWIYWTLGNKPIEKVPDYKYPGASVTEHNSILLKKMSKSVKTYVS